MQIPKEYLTEKNYEGTRLIEVVDDKVAELKKELTALQIEANPFLEEMEKLSPVLDPFFVKIGEHQAAIDALKKEMEEPKAEYNEWLKKVEEIDQKAQLIKNKIVPLVNAIVAPSLGEFEKANQMVPKDDKLFVEVIDEIEEKVKSIRATKTK